MKVTKTLTQAEIREFIQHSMQNDYGIFVPTSDISFKENGAIEVSFEVKQTVRSKLSYPDNVRALDSVFGDWRDGR